MKAESLENIDWKDSKLALDEKAKIEEILVELHDVFARHQFDIGTNEEFNMRMTPEDDSAASRQSPPASINLKEDILVELAMHDTSVFEICQPNTSVFQICQPNIC